MQKKSKIVVCVSRTGYIVFNDCASLEQARKIASQMAPEDERVEWSTDMNLHEIYKEN